LRVLFGNTKKKWMIFKSKIHFFYHNFLIKIKKSRFERVKTAFFASYTEGSLQSLKINLQTNTWRRVACFVVQNFGFITWNTVRTCEN
jgi:hypothetical protein